ncbi:hypothetical protein MMC07_000234 [Pseudocyphellaria aurata]|nr:hypothetical protein [Pseudocyphellaria aurata]
MSRACLSQVPLLGQSTKSRPVRFDFKEESATYHLYPRISDLGEEIEISKEPRPTHDLIAKLYIARWSIVLESFSQIQIRAQGWGPEKYSGIKLTAFSPLKGSMIYLRPNDVLQFGQVTLQISREILETPQDSKVQVTSSEYDGATADPQRAHRDMEVDTTIMETPVASRHTLLNDSPIKSAAAEDGTRDLPDNQNQEQHLISPDIQASSREVIERTEAVELEKLRSDSNGEENGHAPDKPLDETSMGDPSVEGSISGVRNGVSGADKKSTRDLSNVLLDLANLKGGVLVPSSHGGEISSPDDRDTEEGAKRSATSFVEASNISPQSPPAMTSRQSSRKRKRVGDESQDSMKSVIHVVVPPSDAEARNADQQSPGGESVKIGSVKKKYTKKKSTNASQKVSDPPLSSKSARVITNDDSTMLRSTNPKLRVFFASSTTVDNSSKFMGFLESHGVTKVKSVKDCDILCIGNNDLKKTCNLVLAVMLGKEVITKDWVVQSVAQGDLLDHRDFLARDPAKEAEWETDLGEAIERGKQGVKPFLDYTVHFTPAAKKELGKGFADLKDIATHAGAKSVLATLPRKSSLAEASKSIIIALPDDSDLPALEDGGWKSFSKDMVTLSVLRGSLDVNNDEFLIRRKARSESNKRRKR